MQNPIQKFRQSSIIFKKPGILFENLKTLTSSKCGIFVILFRSWVICLDLELFVSKQCVQYHALSKANIHRFCERKIVIEKKIVKKFGKVTREMLLAS